MAPILLITVALLVSGALAAGHRNPKVLIKGEDNGRKNVRSTDCQFGKETYELGETWNPDLGAPFGIMYCVKCECIAVHKKRRVIGKTRCRNVKNECPKPACEEPVLPPKSCCKVCPTKSLGHEFPQEDRRNYGRDYQEEEEKNNRDFAILMSGRTSNHETSAVATGRLTFQKKNLYYSFYVEGLGAPPRYLQFQNKKRDILEEHELDANAYQNASRKVCGVWRKVPRVYRKILKEDGLYLSLTTEKSHDDIPGLRGKVTRYRGFNSEMYSAVLAPSDSSRGGGGTAIVSVSPQTGSFHFDILFNGIFGAEETADVAIGVRLEADKGAEETRIIEEMEAKVGKPDPELNKIEVRTTLDGPQMKQLARAKYTMTVYSKRNPHLYVKGYILPRVNCEIFDTVLSANSMDDKAPGTTAAGLAWIYRTVEGGFNYNIHLDGLSSNLPTITIETGQKKKRKVIEEVPVFDNGWSRGSLTKMFPRDLELLYNGDVYINVVAGQSELRGQLKLRLFGDSQVSDSPVLLRTEANLSEAESLPPAGLTWMSVDRHCQLHYEMELTGVPTNQQLQLELEEMSPNKVNSIVQKQKLILERFTGDKIEGQPMEMSKIGMSRLDSGVSVLKVTMTKDDDEEVLLEGRVKGIRVPGECLPQARSPSMGPSYENVVNHDEKHNEIPQTYSCYYEGRSYDDNTEWVAEHDRCMMCNCQRGRVVCDPLRCPKLSCLKTVHLPNECCPTCSNGSVEDDSRSCYFEGEKRHYPPGSSWHPYIRPFGYSECVTCTCNENTLEVKCNKKPCPPLACPDSESVRPTPQACCRECSGSVSGAQGSGPGSPGGANDGPLPHRTGHSLSGSSFSDQALEPSVDDKLAAGGCRFKDWVYPNGKEWHPRVQPYGEMKCVLCRCKDGNVHCSRKKCPEKTCSMGQQDDRCCPKCPLDGPRSTSNSRKPRKRNNKRPKRPESEFFSG